MKQNAQTNNAATTNNNGGDGGKLDAATLARIITGAILDEYTARGYVAGPATQAQAAPLAAAVRQARPRANARQTPQAVPVVNVELPHVAPLAAPKNEIAPAHSTYAMLSDEAFTAHAPEGITAKIGGERDPRIKLPKELFAATETRTGYSTVVLVWPNGVQTAVQEDSEGRARFNRKLALEYTGASEGQYLAFEEGNAGFYHVHVRNAVMRPTKAHKTSEEKAAEIESAGRALMYAGTTPQTPQAKTAAVAVPLSTFAAMFGGPFAGVPAVQTASAAPEKAKRPASAAQLAARQKFADAARAKAAARKSGVVVDGGPITPKYETGNKKGRKAPAHNVGAKQMAYAAVPVAPLAPVAVAVPLGVVDNTGRADRMKATLAARVVAVPVSK